ncbi:MAG TPA: hypothetical protein VL068_15300, partial [Microthrixaceae bacterium]|nr:hypothetical protein [Microthrixaceae bacterium]
RRGWLFGRLCLGAATIVILGPFAALACWLGAVSFGAQVPFWSTIAAGINIVPAALIALAFGAMVFAFAPRAAPASVEILVGWSLVVDLLGSLVTGLAQLTRLSLFHYVTLAPAADPNWGSLIAATLLACVMAVTALAVFGRRDLAAD